MPNWAEVEIDFEIPTKNVEKFLNCFLEWEGRERDSTDFHLARTYLEYCSYDEIENKNDLGDTIEVSIDLSCAWSIYSCWINGFVEDKATTKKMESFCEEFEVIWLNAYSIEEGMGFSEEYEYKKGREPIYDCNNLPKKRIR